MKKFIKVTDAETAQKLISEGFQLIQKDNTSWTFLNSSTSNFSAEANAAYTDILSV